MFSNCETTKFKTQQHIVFGCNEENAKEEDVNKNINGQNAMQYEEEEQTSDPDIETVCKNKMTSE